MSTYICREYVSGHFEIAENDTGARVATVDKCYGDVARIMAAAPDLLAALEAIEKRCSSTEFLGIRAAKDLRDTARAAIARAKGEA